MSKNKRPNQSNRGGNKDFNRNQKSQREDKKPNSSAKGTHYEDIKGNDISWWDKSSLYPLATSVQYNKMPGYLYDQSTLAPVRNTATYAFGDVASFPSVMAIEYVPTLGKSADGNSPVNLCFNSLFAELVAHTNSANVGFQQADLALLTLAVGSIINTIAECERALGLSNVYFRENASFPKGLLAATGYTWTDVTNNKAKYMLTLQSLVQNFNALEVPSYIDLFKRSMQMGRNIYMDEDNVMAQAYCFVAQGTYEYKDTEMSLKYTPYSGNDRSMATTLGRLSSMIEALRNTSDFGNIMGALKRAFPDTATIVLDTPSTADVTVPTYDRNVTWQVNNMTICQYPLVNLDVTQDPTQNILLCTPSIQLPWLEDEVILKSFINGAQNEFLINSYDGTIGPEFIMESTRLMFSIENAINFELVNGVKYAKLQSFGTEIVTAVRVLTAVKGVNGIEYQQFSIQPLVDFDNSSVQDLLGTFTQLSKFRNHPMLHVCGSETSTYYGTFGDLYTFTTITPAQLEYIHLAALQSIYLITTAGERKI